MPPAGRLELTGFAAEATAIGALLQRVGITAQFVRRGDYKTVFGGTVRYVLTNAPSRVMVAAGKKAA